VHAAGPPHSARPRSSTLRSPSLRSTSTTSLRSRTGAGFHGTRAGTNIHEADGAKILTKHNLPQRQCRARDRHLNFDETRDNLTGDRQLNYALHVIAITQIRHHASGQVRVIRRNARQVYYERKRAAGKTDKEGL
jgi:hypothetical protein